MPEYDARYLAGIVLFNRHDFFEAHEVWEDPWRETSGVEHHFYQGLIQAAVALCHFANGNLRGAAKLYRTSRNYLQACPSPYFGLDLARFGQEMERCFAAVLNEANPEARPALDPSLVPRIDLDPPPPTWPDPPAADHDE